MTNIILSITCVTQVFAIIFFIRNHMVYSFRMEVLHNHGLETYGRLPSYNHMVFDVFTWDLNQYLKKDKKG